MIIHNPILTGSFTVNGTDVSSITSSAASITAINSYTASQNILNGTYATTGSNTFKNPQTINSNLIVTGSITAATLVVQTITSSVIYSSGSNVFGNNIANTQVMTGSLLLTGSATFNGALTAGATILNGLLNVGSGSISSAAVNINSNNSTAAYLYFNGAGITNNHTAITGLEGATSNLKFYTANTQRMVIDSSGNIGMGLTALTNTALAIKGTYGLWIERGATNDSGLSIAHDGTNAYLASSYQSTGAFGGLAFYTSNIQRMLITTGGDIQIPLGKYFQWSADTGSAATRSWAIRNNETVNGDFAISSSSTNNNTINTTRLVITSGGLVGLNTTSPNASYRLTLSGASSGVVAGLAMVDTEAYTFSIYSASSALLVRDVTNGAERMRFTSTGKITYGAGTYFTTNYSGGFVFNSSTDAYNNFIASDNGNATLRGTLTQNASDERLKNNIKLIPNAIEKINSLRGVTFEWNHEIYETTRTNDIGVIAQDVQKVLPEAVTLAPFDINIENNTSKSGENYLTVYYEKLIPLLIEGIKELQAQITELKNK